MYSKQLHDQHFGWCGSEAGEYTVYADGALEFLRSVDVFHKLTTDNITFQCEEKGHSLKRHFWIGKTRMRTHNGIPWCVVQVLTDLREKVFVLKCRENQIEMRGVTSHVHVTRKRLVRPKASYEKPIV
uniref:Uncharacterized protein n=1 Tax=Lactuca sativa TaxID=4236 RepID=A0A9R1WCY0_LACSA|nr:hypothetical protein LSAT_V11C200066690 [Lactuca sativa]